MYIKEIDSFRRQSTVISSFSILLQPLHNFSFLFKRKKFSLNIFSVWFKIILFCKFDSSSHFSLFIKNAYTGLLRASERRKNSHLFIFTKYVAHESVYPCYCSFGISFFLFTVRQLNKIECATLSVE